MSITASSSGQAAHAHTYGKVSHKYIFTYKEQTRLHLFMNSIGESCNEIKKQYDACFQTWFSDKFLKGDTNDSIIIMEACNQLKKNYDECFNSWFSEKFLKGDTDDSSCSVLLDVYKECVQKAIKDHKIEIKDLEVSVLETEKEKQPPS